MCINSNKRGKYCIHLKPLKARKAGNDFFLKRRNNTFLRYLFDVIDVTLFFTYEF